MASFGLQAGKKELESEVKGSLATVKVKPG